jgi:tRNA pseudouridine38-40 synthase
MKIKLTIEYDGLNFSGWQAQNGEKTIQGELENVISSVIGTPITLYASGRTDAGVSAKAQVAHFEIEDDFKFDAFSFLGSVNFFLCPEICVKSAEIASDDFDSRFTAKRKTYRYYFYISRYERPLFSRYLRVNDNVSLDKMKAACRYLVGEHDFSSFVARKSGKTNFVRTIYSAGIVDLGDGLYALEICGNGFLYNMVRIIMGTIISVSKPNHNPEEIKNIIDSMSRQKAGKTVSGVPLCLMNVEYN